MTTTSLCTFAIRLSPTELFLIRTPIVFMQPIRVVGKRLIIIRNPYAELSLSSTSKELDFLPGFVAPTADYSYEGFTVMLEGRSWKLISSLALSPTSPLLSVEFDGDRIAFYYKEYSVTYTLDGPCLKVRFDGSPAKVIPIVELRDVFGDPNAISISQGRASLSVKSDQVGFRVSGAEITLIPLKTFQKLYDKGSGFRRGTPPEPIAETKNISILFSMQPTAGSTITICPIPKLLLPEIRAPNITENAFPEFMAHREFSDLLLRRVQALTRFSVACRARALPDAGAWWFRQVWSRDLYQGLLWNVKTLDRIPGGRQILWDAAEIGIGSYSPRGLLPNRLCSSEEQNNVDSFPLFMLYLMALLKVDWRESYAKSLVSIARSFLDTKRQGNGFFEEGFILSDPWASWWDSRIWVNGKLRSTRLPNDWPEGGHYALPEVNALYALAYDAVGNLAEKLGQDPGPFLDFSSTLIRSLWSISRGYLPSIYDVQAKKGNYMPASVAVMAYSLLRPLREFPFSDLWDGVISKLLVRKKVGLKAGQEAAFGILVRQSPGPYLGDAEYHGAVVWPRDTPYLIAALKGHDDRLIGDLLLSNLDATLNDGAVFFVPELYSLDGNELVPVKNPAQFWSNWVDPYIDNINLLEGL